MKRCKATLCFTYSKVTPESARNGETSEHGFCMPGGWEYPCPDDPNSPEYEAWLADEYDVVCDDAADLVRTVQHECGSVEADSYPLTLRARGRVEVSFRSVEPDQDFSTGEDTERTAHVECDARLMRAIAARLGVKVSC